MKNPINWFLNEVAHEEEKTINNWEKSRENNLILSTLTFIILGWAILHFFINDPVNVMLVMIFTISIFGLLLNISKRYASKFLTIRFWSEMRR